MIDPFNIVKVFKNEATLGLGDLAGNGAGIVIDHPQPSLPGDYFIVCPNCCTSPTRNRNGITPTIFSVEISPVDLHVYHSLQFSYFTFWRDSIVYHTR